MTLHKVFIGSRLVAKTKDSILGQQYIAKHHDAVKTWGGAHIVDPEGKVVFRLWVGHNG